MTDPFDPFLDDCILFKAKKETTESSCLQLMSKLQNLSPLLQTLGLSSFIDSDDIDKCLEIAYQNIHSLLRLRQNEINNRNKIEEELFKSKSDSEALKVKIQRNVTEADNKCKQIGQHENSLALLNRQFKFQLDKHILEKVKQQLYDKEDLQKQIFKLQQKASQVQVELRKKEVEGSKFKEQVQLIKYQKLKKSINEKHQVIRNNFDVTDLLMNPKKQEQIYQNFAGWDSWTQLRKQLLDENFIQKETIEKLISAVQNFIFDTSQLAKINLQGTINTHRAYLTKSSGLIESVKDQLNQLKVHFHPDQNDSMSISSKYNSGKKIRNSHMESVTILQSSGFTFQDNKENDKLKPRQKSQDKTSNRFNLGRYKSECIKKKINGLPDQIKFDLLSDVISAKSEQDMNQSFLSRISFKDIPNPKDNFLDSPGFQDKQQPQENMKELKKWDFVFKQS